MVSLSGDDQISRPDEDPYTNTEELSASLFVRVINCVRFHDIPAINFVIIIILGGFLAKLTTKYNELYMKNSLVTIMVTNLVLYGISETLAQTLLSYDATAARVSIRIRENQPPFYHTEDNLYMDDVDAESVDEENLDRFLDYLQASENETLAAEPITTEREPALRLTYFHFNRLAGFMCWGFLLAFAQCWWYNFLQIYSVHPQFIEVLRKVMSDQFCYSPVSLFSFFTYGTIVLENGTWEDTKQKLRRIYLPTLVVNFSVWFPVQFINFLLVPRSFQVPFSSSVSVLWNCFLSMRNSSA